jgi:hypothetical protein
MMKIGANGMYESSGAEIFTAFADFSFRYSYIKPRIGKMNSPVKSLIFIKAAFDM